ncbi:hypothetical protein [Ammoniphilus sp. CFH 90114]|uniref:hypothetical protein n=1 Tax=Ammoniphilus sp. CFH 90114 TaxID=2493665 RepID=UPI0013E97D4D|nr:hypothetical protein [Ammoniphilus sp. CFH 90114]
MVLRSAIVAILLFFALFASAWFVHTQLDRYGAIHHNEADVEIARIQQIDFQPFDPFQPREYIKIRERFRN